MEVNRIIHKLVISFRDKYFSYDDGSKCDIGCIDRREDELSYNWQFGDYFFSLQDIYYAMRYNIPEDTLFEWYDKSIDEGLKKQNGKPYETVPNLKNYYLLRK